MLASPLRKFRSGESPRTDSSFTVLMDVHTAKVLYSENMLSHREPASLTKMAAAIVLIQNGKLTDRVTTPTGLTGIPDSSLHLSAGETISLHDLLYAMLLRSANDTPVVGSYYLCGGITPFVQLMNQKVRAIGCANTNFVTPNGLYAPEHYSCPYDLALIARYGLTQVPFFRQVVRTHEYRVDRSIHKGDSVVVNTASKFLADFPGADGVKTGYISQAGHCFVGSATRGGWQLIAVALNSPHCRGDVVHMLSYGFANFAPHMIHPAGFEAGVATFAGRTVSVKTDGALWDVLPRSEGSPPDSDYTTRIVSLDIPATENIAVGQQVGTVTLYKGNGSVMTVGADADVSSAGVPNSILPTPVSSSNVPLQKIVILAVFAAAAPVLLFLARILEIVLHARTITKDSLRRRTHFTEDVRTVDS